MPADLKATSNWSRRRFLHFSLASAAAMGGCSDLGLEEEETSLFDGPIIDEQDFIAVNANYYGRGVDPVTRVPFRELRDGSIVQETGPVSIAYRLQHLLSRPGNQDEVDTLLTHLVGAQISERPPRNFRNMLPRMKVESDGLVPAVLDYSFTDNAVLSARVAMAAQLFNGTTTGDKALTFLDKQKVGYNQALAQSSGFMPTFAHAGLFGVDPTGFNLLFGGYYASLAFVLAYFIGGTPMLADPQAGLDAWESMIAAQNSLVGSHPASTTGPHTIQTPLARNGSAYQFFHSLLALNPEDLTDSMRNGLYNALYSYLDASVYDRIPGIYSAGPHGGGFLLDNGLNRLSGRQRQQSSQETIVTVDALAAALRLFPEDSDERTILRGWIGLYASVAGATGAQGFYGGVDRDGNPIKAIYARQNGAMILFNSSTAGLLNSFLAANGRPGMRELMSQVEIQWAGGPMARIDDQLPIPIRQERLFTKPPGS